MNSQRERGSVLIMTALILPLAIGVCGLGLELSMAFQRQSQLQQVADAVALSAAQQLDDTANGISRADDAASDAVFNRYVRGVDRVRLKSATVLSFSASADGPWLGFNAALAAPGGLRYARADMAGQGEDFTVLPVAFGRLLGGSDATTVGARAVAGPNGLRVLPLAICAPSSVPTATRYNGPGMDERIDYGFRFGVAYNLLALNPAAGASSGEYFLVDPASPPGSTPLPASTDNSQVAPFMCTGKLAYHSLAGALHLRRNGSFGLWQQLNSRFGNYSGNACDPNTAPPDNNVREYRGTLASWISSYPPQAAAASSTPAAGKPLMSVADGAYPLPAVAPAQYGTLWAYGPARRSNNNPFLFSHWNSLYPASPAFGATGTSWPSSGPYNHTAFATAPTGYTGRKHRRLLYVPLLACPVPAGANVDGTVLAVARFLLTAQASATEVPGEFAGILSAQELAALATDVELLR